MSENAKLYVVVGNKTPDSTFATREAAQRYVDAKRAEIRPGHAPSIQWHICEREVKS